MFKMYKPHTIFAFVFGISGAAILFGFGMQVVLADTESSHVTIEFQVGASLCGNGVVDIGEACDDGNLSNTDACLNTCEIAICGDGFVRAGTEECDDGEANGSCPANCSSSCTINSCGGGGSSDPPVVTIVESIPSYDSMTTSWTANGGTIVGCTVSWSLSFGGAGVGSTDVYTLDDAVYTSTITGLDSETMYYITVTCTNTDALQGSDSDSARTTAAPIFLEKTITVEALAGLRDTTLYQHENLDFVLRFIDPITGVPISDFSAVTDDVTGVYTGVQTIPVGTGFIAEIKGISHLSKRIVGVDTTVDDIILDFTDGGLTRLRPGDVRASTETNALPEYTGKNPLNDDIIEGADLSLVLSYFGTVSPDAYKILDFNRDAEDVNIFITEGSELSTVLSRFGTIVTYSL